MCSCHVNFLSTPSSSLCTYIPRRVTSVFRLFDLTFSCPLFFPLPSSKLCVFHFFTLFLSPAFFCSLIIYIFTPFVPPLHFSSFNCFFSLAASLYTVYTFLTLSSVSLLLHPSPSLLIIFFSSTLIPPHYIHLTKELLEVSLQSVSFSWSQVDGDSLCKPKYQFNPVTALGDTYMDTYA